VLGIREPITVLPNGSGDTTWNYVQLFGMVMISLIVGTAWVFADRRRPNYVGLHAWTMVIVRHALAWAMVMYGLIKVFKAQFPFPGLTTLTQTYGEASPMGLAWTFMGYSSGYNLFTGSAEVLAGVLLLTRRTTTLGALVAIGVTANVAAMNYCYDIPVKLFSSTLLLMAVYLFADDARRFFDLLVFNRATAPVELRPHFTRPWARRLRVALKVVFVLLLALIGLQAWFQAREYGPDGPREPLYGLYEVESFRVGDVVRPPLTTDGPRWRQFIVEQFGFVAVRTMDGKRTFFASETDVDARTISLERRGDQPVTLTLHYEQPEPDALVLRGDIPEGPAEITLRRRDPRDFELVKRGFHWVNEYPYNR
jgi:uncharacterized membrane protein YphA (DoxX/SURF4 family)